MVKRIYKKSTSNNSNKTIRKTYKKGLFLNHKYKLLLLGVLCIAGIVIAILFATGVLGKKKGSGSDDLATGEANNKGSVSGDFEKTVIDIINKDYSENESNFINLKNLYIKFIIFQNVKMIKDMINKLETYPKFIDNINDNFTINNVKYIYDNILNIDWDNDLDNIMKKLKQISNNKELNNNIELVKKNIIEMKKDQDFAKDFPFQL